MITTKLLKSIDACEDGIMFFKEQSPSGKASFAKATDACLNHKHADYAAWLAQYCPNIPGATWEARLALQRTNTNRAYLARNCPDIPGATWEARLALQQNEYERTNLAFYCPDIPGASWEARLALQRTDEERTSLKCKFHEPVRAALGKGKPNPNPNPNP